MHMIMVEVKYLLRLFRVSLIHGTVFTWLINHHLDLNLDPNNLKFRSRELVIRNNREQEVDFNRVRLHLTNRKLYVPMNILTRWSEWIQKSYSPSPDTVDPNLKTELE